MSVLLCCEYMIFDGFLVYFDQELFFEEVEKIEFYFLGCISCQCQLEGLRFVVGGLCDFEWL